MKKFNWEVICHEERIKGISIVEQSINKYGFILNFKMFSDISMSMMTEIPENKINALYSDLSNLMSLSDYEAFNSVSEKEAIVFLNITFSKGTGDMRIEVPDIGD